MTRIMKPSVRAAKRGSAREGVAVIFGCGRVTPGGTAVVLMG
jgi:hypothetical protein